MELGPISFFPKSHRKGALEVHDDRPAVLCPTSDALVQYFMYIIEHAFIDLPVLELSHKGTCGKV